MTEARSTAAPQSLRVARWLVRVARSPARLMALNVIVMVAAIGTGWVSGTASPSIRRTNVPAAAGESHDFAQDAAHIIQGNLRVVATLLIGACTGGLLTVAVLVWNGYQLGFGLAVLTRSAFEDLHLLMRYLPFEFAGLWLASSASMSLSMTIGLLLFAGERTSPRSAMWMVTASLCLLVIAGLIEAGVKRQIGQH